MIRPPSLFKSTRPSKLTLYSALPGKLRKAYISLITSEVGKDTKAYRELLQET